MILSLSRLDKTRRLHNIRRHPHISSQEHSSDKRRNPSDSGSTGRQKGSRPCRRTSGVDTRPPAAASHPTPSPKKGRRVVSRGRARRASAHMRLQPSLLGRGHAPPSA
eukprot:scaffold20109_cov143-Isochrysis_galbana.AAC.2